MTNILVTMIVGFVILSVTLITVAVAFWAWGEVFSPTMTTISNMTGVSNSTDVSIAELQSRSDTTMYIVMLIIIGIPVALIIFDSFFARERYEYGQ